MAAAATTLTPGQRDWYRARLGVPGAPMMSQPASPDALAEAVLRWDRLRQSDGYPFTDYSSFLIEHPGWPGETAMRRAAEKAINVASYSPSEVVRFFTALPPLTNTGQARYAEALFAMGQPDRARDAARKAWTGGVLSAEDEARLLGRFGSVLTPVEHDQRMETLLWQRATAAAQRQILFASPARRPLYEARLAMQARNTDAPLKVSALGSAASADAGYLVDRARYLRDTGASLQARQLFATTRRLDAPPFDPEKWLDTLLVFARGAANDSQWTSAYGIAGQLDDAYPAGTSVRDQPLGERDDYTSLAWLAGTVALNRMARPADAVGMFDRYARAARTPQTQSKGFYWAGRAAQAAGNATSANSYFTLAAAFYDQFYGQLAAERLGRKLPQPESPAVVSIPMEARAAFNQSELVRAARLLRDLGAWQDQTQFVRAIAAKAENANDHLLASELSKEIGRPDLGVMVARNARIDGSIDYLRSGFPEVRVPEVMAHRWTMIHAISRQESQFDREAVSHAGARGLMQLMPGTAREQAGKLGLPYDNGRLTLDTSYNIMLGSGYFERMLNYYGGNHVLAVAAYNAGPGNVNKWLTANGDPRLGTVDVIQWIEAIPLFETRNYVQRVLENAVVYDLVNPDKARMPAHNPLSAYLGKRTPG